MSARVYAERVVNRLARTNPELLLSLADVAAIEQEFTSFEARIRRDAELQGLRNHHELVEAEARLGGLHITASDVPSWRKSA